MALLRTTRLFLCLLVFPLYSSISQPQPTPAPAQAVPAAASPSDLDQCKAGDAAACMTYSTSLAAACSTAATPGGQIFCSRKASCYSDRSLALSQGNAAIDSAGRPIFLISNMAMHTQNLQADPRASLFVGQASDGDPLGTARATLVGDVLPVPDEELGPVRELYLSRYETSRSWVDFKDFAFYRLQPFDIYYVGGFGVMGWVAADDYAEAEVDPLATEAPRILGHMNADHVPAMILLAKVHSGLDSTEAAMTAVDRLGFNLRLKTSGGMKGTRINFLREIKTAEETRKVFVEMVRAAEVNP
jgi:putative heme iron utilization protein